MTRCLLLFSFLFLAQIAIAQPEPCEDPDMASTCLGACIICDIDGFTGTNNLQAGGTSPPGFCSTPDDMHWIAFIAGSEFLSIQIDVSGCTNSNWQSLDLGFFESLDCQNFTPITACTEDLENGDSFVFNTLAPLTIGQYYYLVMDGTAGSICDWTFSVLEGTTEVSPLTTSGEIMGNLITCPDLPTTYTTIPEVGATLFYWTIDGVQQSNADLVTELQFPADGFYEICVSAANACDEAPPVCTTIEVVTPEILNIDQVLCDNDSMEVAGQILTETGEYQFVVLTENGCDSIINVTLEVLEQAEAFIDINLCAGQDFLIGTTPYGTTGIFMDTILTDLFCDSIVNLDLFIIECEIIGATDYIEPICNGEANGFLIFSVENGTPPFNYDWSNILEPSIGGIGSTLLYEGNMIAGVPAGTYEINIADEFGNDVVVFQEVTEPEPLVVALEASDINGLNISCFEGADGTLLATPSGGVAPYTYEWSNLEVTASIAGLAVGNYSVNVTDAYGCIETSDFTLEEPSPIVIDANFIDPNCDGFETGIIEIDSVFGGTPPYLYSLTETDFDGTLVYPNLPPGDHDVYVQDENDCIYSTTGTLLPIDIPIIDVGENQLLPLGCDAEIPTSTNGSNIVYINWTNGATLDCDSCLQPVAFPVENSDYALTVMSVDSCFTSDSLQIVVDKVRDIYFPNVFSPNQDGFNDYFYFGGGKSVSRIVSLRIFGRWGQQVFEANDILPDSPLDGWDGRFRDKFVDSGVYTWVAEILYLDEEIILTTGDITIIR